jgi:drug/metabolite transporter (DMT)-like permease
VRRVDLRKSGLPRDVGLACGAGAVVGTVAAATAYWLYLHDGGPTSAGIAVVPASLLIVAIAYALLARRRRRLGDWLGLGYTVAVVGVTGLLMLWEIVRGFYAQLSFAAW